MGKWRNGKLKMYRFNDSIPLNQLIGLTMIQVCIGANEVILRFDDNSSILIQSFDQFIIDNHLKTPAGNMTVPVGLGQPVEKAVMLNERCIRINFQGGSLLLRDDSDQYESVVLELAGGRYVV
jgi:hypothetical protein